MKNEYNFQLTLPLPPPVVTEYVCNPWLFFNPMAHIAVLKNITDKKWDIIFSPDVEQSKGTTYYGTLDGPLVKNNNIEYECKSMDNEVKMKINIKLKPMGIETSIELNWTLETSLGFFDKLMGENFSLTPEHIFKKHLSQRLPEMMRLINYKEEGREFLLEKTYLSGTSAIPYIKNKARDLRNCIVLGTSNSIKFNIEIGDEQLLTIHSESGNRENFGGEAILDILNNPDEICICFYSIQAKGQYEELMRKQVHMIKS
ncbi:hypothetical protein ACNF40_08385 [Cuniculiplasma sp. SKW4]|uniref:hypothetical protein n=1 Tax=Cuniculiplasma sp. SKW4 TaxID=3400171 RepID=UPI003FD2566F